MSRLPARNREDVPELEELFIYYERTRGFVPNSLYTMAHRPDVVRAFVNLNHVIAYEGSIDYELKALVATMASLTAGCRYCQAHQTLRGQKSGASQEKLQALWDFDTSEVFDPRERAAIRFARDASTVPNSATEANFVELRECFTAAEVVELLAAIALFGFLNRWNDTMATKLEDEPASMTEQLLGATRWTAGKHR